jgi:hypothetical protein
MPDDLKSTTKQGRRGIVSPDPRAEAKRKQIEEWARMTHVVEAVLRTRELDRLLPSSPPTPPQAGESTIAYDLHVLQSLPGPLLAPALVPPAKRNYGTPEAALAAFYAVPGNRDLGQAAAFKKYRDEEWRPKRMRKAFPTTDRRGPLPRR